jgi:hypothetical protein
MPRSPLRLTPDHPYAEEVMSSSSGVNSNSSTAPPLDARTALRMALKRGKYHGTLALKSAASAVLTTRRTPLPNAPSVTLFMSSFNTRRPLELTLKSLAATTKHPDYRFHIGDNASEDGSREYLQEVAKRLDMDLVLSETPRKHAVWLDEMMRTVQTKYWFAVDTDILFFGTDWLTDMLTVLENDPELYLLNCEPRPGVEAYIEPVGHETIDMGEAVASWLFGMRTSLRDHIQTSFAFADDDKPSRNGRRLCYDTGGKLLADMRAKGLRYATMPSWFQLKYHHFGSLSWWKQHTESNDPHILFKKFQLNDIERRLTTGRWPASPF